jgi:hypothetical protein
MKLDQRLMRLAAEKQAHERANREGVTCHVYQRIGYPTAQDVTWYVRTEQEGEPEGTTREYTAEPGTENY